ncbi:fumarylacetoacetate hydrolase domain-containing protein (plasmid) [Rhizobium etli]|uniref:Fumarylacetoacetate hydrolase domain-containing protein n=1 Tax=Rhizobium etli TaxID=29449 RepID=A0AAN1ENU7_RHIET|nr:fumarylacetoacetate hydrolase domain-containing protein [Rhizobium etli]
MLSQDEIQAAAESLAERTRVQTGLLSLKHPEMTIDDSYAVQNAWVQKKIAAGRKPIGWKIGLTSKGVAICPQHQHSGFRRALRRHGVRGWRNRASRPLHPPTHRSRDRLRDEGASKGGKRLDLQCDLIQSRAAATAVAENDVGFALLSEGLV